uniref:Uncharacterized protein n=1 Tax=Rhizophora mucronata TaxID=61149 RepID=A0A2P2PB09_RHIMU
MLFAVTKGYHVENLNFNPFPYNSQGASFMLSADHNKVDISWNLQY